MSARCYGFSRLGGHQTLVLNMCRNSHWCSFSALFALVTLTYYPTSQRNKWLSAVGNSFWVNVKLTFLNYFSCLVLTNLTRVTKAMFAGFVQQTQEGRLNASQ